mmetsp:Transcript_4299/g.9525  ORF Transcript_4299/g.9525 Transcript_4299/m.9525 type:complete len:288 (+) Transcript_4299:82-945(+)
MFPSYQNFNKNTNPIELIERDVSKTPSCYHHSNQDKKIESSRMTGRSFYNPLSKISKAAARRRKSSGSSGDKGNFDRTNDRKISIDHTVLTGDDSRHNPSSRSFDADGSVEIFPRQFSKEYPADEHGADSRMKASLSEPSFLAHHPIPDSMYQYQEHSPSALSPNLCNSVRSLPSSPGAAGHQNAPQPPATPKSNDPALQARIEAIRIQQQLLGDNHPDVIFALSSLAKLHQKRGNYAEAASILRESQMRRMQAQSGPKRTAPSAMHRDNPQEEQCIPVEISFAHFG